MAAGEGLVGQPANDLPINMLIELADLSLQNSLHLIFRHDIYKYFLITALTTATIDKVSRGKIDLNSRLAGSR